MAKEQHKIINRSVMLLSLIIVSLAAQWGWSTYLNYHAANDMILVNQLADDLISASNIEAEERGMTSLLLGESNAELSTLLDQVTRLRQEGDAIWLKTKAAIHNMHQHDTDNRVSTNLHQANTAYLLFQEARTKVDNQISGTGHEISPKTWIKLSTSFISSIALLRESLLAMVEMPRELGRLNLTFKHRLWLASEYAGRERGILAYYVNSNKAVPARVQIDLLNYRAVVEKELQEIIATKQYSHDEEQVHVAINKMERIFFDEFSRVREQVYRGVSNGIYPISGIDWVKQATIAIDSIIAIKTTITEVSNRYALEIKKQSLFRFAVILALLLLAFALIILALLKVRQTTNDLFQQKELAQFTLSSIGDAVISTDEKGNIRSLNPIAEKMIGWSTAEIRGEPLRDYFNIINGLTRITEPNPIDICLQEKRVVGLNDNTILIGRDGTEYGIEDSAAPIRNHQGDAVGAVMVFYESCMNHTENHMLSYHASHDSLTRLINRREYERRLTELLTSAKNSGEKHALCYLDLDQFKIVNDTCGHVAGDKLLRQITYLFQGKVRDADTLARLGGDEFGLLLENCPLKEAMKIAEGLRKVVKDFRFAWEDKTFEISVSIGVVPITADSISPAEILSDADAACFTAKDKGRNCIQLYEPGNMELARRYGEMQWVSRITEALEEDRFILYSQSIKPLNEKFPEHVELLIRMLDKDGEVIAPMAFIPAAERYNLMQDIDYWVIRSAFAAIRKYAEHNPDDRIVYNINLSGTSLGQKELANYICSQI
ncbi:MAG: diguanylate cyclase, partial [Gammaproteobacteria bacterium]|nr:diguanylate cyclase [Gammaproteobacteria bacterium]